MFNSHLKKTNNPFCFRQIVFRLFYFLVNDWFAKKYDIFLLLNNDNDKKKQPTYTWLNCLAVWDGHDAPSGLIDFFIYAFKKQHLYDRWFNSINEYYFIHDLKKESTKLEKSIKSLQNALDTLKLIAFLSLSKAKFQINRILHHDWRSIPSMYCIFKMYLSSNFQACQTSTIGNRLRTEH